MAKQTRTTVNYEVDLEESTFALWKITKTEVSSGRGTHWSEGGTEREKIASGLSPHTVSRLAASAADALAYIAESGWEDK